MTSAPSRRSRRRWIAATVAVTVAAALCWYAVNQPLSVNEKRFVGYWRLSIDGDPQHDVQFHSDHTVWTRSPGGNAFDDEAVTWSVRDDQLVARPVEMTWNDRLDLLMQGFSVGELRLSGWDEWHDYNFISDDEFELWDEAMPDIRRTFIRIEASTPPLRVDDEENE